MAQAELAPLSRVVDQIKTLCAQRQTGTVFLVSDDNRMAQIHLDRGEIVSLAHRNRRGLNALAVLVTMNSARLRFDDTYVTTIEKHDLSTQAIFDFLDSKQPLVETSAQAMGYSAFSALAAETKSAIQQIMATYIGPMAEIICADHFARTNDPRSLAQSLAGEISDKEQADSFFQAISVYLDSVAPTIAKPVKVPGSAAPGVFAPELRVAVLKIMTAYVGPMAEIVCADHFARASDLRQLARSLADEIPDPQQAAKFAAEIGKALNLSLA